MNRRELIKVLSVIPPVVAITSWTETGESATFKYVHDEKLEEFRRISKLFQEVLSETPQVKWCSSKFDYDKYQITVRCKFFHEFRKQTVTISQTYDMNIFKCNKYGISDKELIKNNYFMLALLGYENNIDGISYGIIKYNVATE